MKRLIILITLLAAMTAAWAVPARRTPFPVVQPNGDTITLVLHGDECWHAYYATDGQVVKQAKSGWWYYARESKCLTYKDRRGVKHPRILRTCRRVKPAPAEAPTQAQQAPPRGLRPHAADSLHYAYIEAYNHALWEQMAEAPRRVGQPITPAPKVLVIMVNFSDYAFFRTRAEVDSLFNAEHLMTPNLGFNQSGLPVIYGYSETGSVRKYFSDQSSGAYNPQFDVVGPVTLSKGYGYYGQNYQGNNTRYAGEMVAEACALVDGQVNFADYDRNGDGKVDLVFIYYAGFGENDPPYEEDYPEINTNGLAWPHYHVLSQAGTNGLSKVFDGKTVEAYECANELDGFYSTPAQPIPAGIGVLVHEYCHGLGLPDLYKTNSGTHKTLGMWSIMDYGPYNDDMHSPPALTAYERWFLGWLEPQLLNEPADITLAPLSETNEAAYLTTNGQPIANIISPGTNEFYLLENRRRSGWDRGLPGEGLLLYRIHFNSANWWNNRVNNTASDMGVDILEADGLTPTSNNTSGGYYGKQGDCYPYQQLDSILVAPAYPIRHISRENNGLIHFDVLGGAVATTTTQTMTQTQTQKVLRNGQILIYKNQQPYTLLGTPIR